MSKTAFERTEQSTASETVQSEKERLTRAERAFDAGDYQSVRKLTQTLTDSADPAVSSAARALHKKISTDPIHLGLLIACLALFCTIAYIFVFHH